MKKFLLPIDGSSRSLTAFTYVKNRLNPKDYEIIIMMVDENLRFDASRDEELSSIQSSESKLRELASALPDYQVTTKADFGRAGAKIVKFARENNIDSIIITKSTKDDNTNSLGYTAEYIVLHAPCDVLFVSEASLNPVEYRGLVYKQVASSVTLRGQLSGKHDECLLPSVSTDCIYHVEVIVGRIAFSHRSYNPRTRDWDIPPTTGQEELVDLSGGQVMDILVKANNVEGRADRIRISNRSLKNEAVFKYRISEAKASK